MDTPSFHDRRKPENSSLSQLVDRVIHSMDYAGESKARFLLAANQVPSTIGARVLFDPEHRRGALLNLTDSCSAESN
ncbi:MAG: hypothetical protein M3R60_14200 [Pseudomonadota bacterium]|nr:hypothetical protein [Pseudomonadota bacterium]